MRQFLFSTLLAASPCLALAESDTAYQALRVFGKQQGEKLLNRVVELRGRNGVAQPQVWKVTASDPSARGGMVEVEVQRGKIISRRTPTSRPEGAGAIMDLNRLNLDSDGAFTIADQEMRQRVIPFDRIDYTLRSSTPGQPPLWLLELFDRGTKVATMHLSADSGTILDQEHFGPTSPSRGTSRDRDYVDAGPDSRRSDDTRLSRPGEPFKGVDDFFHRLGKRFERRGHELKNFFSSESADR